MVPHTIIQQLRLKSVVVSSPVLVSFPKRCQQCHPALDGMLSVFISTEFRCPTMISFLTGGETSHTSDAGADRFFTAPFVVPFVTFFLILVGLISPSPKRSSGSS